MIATLSFLLKISITAISFHWCNDTPIFCYQISSSKIVSPLGCSSRLVRHTLLFGYLLISFIASFGKCHIRVFNTLIKTLGLFGLRLNDDLCHQFGRKHCVTLYHTILTFNESDKEAF